MMFDNTMSWRQHYINACADETIHTISDEFDDCPVKTLCDFLLTDEDGYCLTTDVVYCIRDRYSNAGVSKNVADELVAYIFDCDGVDMDDLLRYMSVRRALEAL